MRKNRFRFKLKLRKQFSAFGFYLKDCHLYAFFRHIEIKLILEENKINFEFILSPVIWYELLLAVKIVSKLLQQNRSNLDFFTFKGIFI